MSTCGKGGRWVRLTTYHPRSTERQENSWPYPTRTPLGHFGLLLETFTYQYCQVIMKLFFFGRFYNNSKTSNEHRHSGRRLLQCGQTDTVKELIVTFGDFVRVHKTWEYLLENAKNPRLKEM